MQAAYCFDFDGTVTREELLPLLSREIGLFEEMSALTEATIRGVIPFRKSFLLRCKLLSEVPISRVREIISEIPLHAKIEEFIRNNRDHSYIITGNLDTWLEPMMERLGCKFFCSKAEVDGNRLVRVNHVLNKGDAVQELRRKYDRIVAIGDGMGDVPMFENANVRIAFGSVHSPIQTLIQLSDFVTYHEDSLCRLLNTL